jgi:hypothetical protein
MHKLGVESHWHQLVEIFFTSRWTHFSSRVQVQTDLKNSLTMLDGIKIPGKLRMKLYKQQAQWILDYIPEDPGDWELITAVYQRAVQKIPDTILSAISKSIAQQKPVNGCLKLKTILNKYQRGNHYPYVCKRVLEFIYRDDSSVSGDAITPLLSMSQKMSENDKSLFSELVKKIQDLITPPENYQQWKNLSELFIKNKVQLRDSFFNSNIMEELRMKSTLSKLDNHDKKLILLISGGAFLLSFLEAEKKLCTMLEIPAIDHYWMLPKQCNFPVLKNYIQDWKEEQKKLVHKFSRFKDLFIKNCTEIKKIEEDLVSYGSTPEKPENNISRRKK